MRGQIAANVSDKLEIRVQALARMVRANYLSFGIGKHDSLRSAGPSVSLDTRKSRVNATLESLMRHDLGRDVHAARTGHVLVRNGKEVVLCVC